MHKNLFGLIMPDHFPKENVFFFTWVGHAGTCYALVVFFNPRQLHGGFTTVQSTQAYVVLNS